MKVRRKNRPNGDIDLTAFSDIAFLLIVFFVLTTTFVRPKGAAVSIPSKTTDPQDKPTHEIPTIRLSADGVALNDKPMEIEAVRAELFGMKLREREEDQRVVLLEPSDDVPFSRYYRIVTAISKSGGILALAEESEDGKNGGGDK